MRLEQALRAWGTPDFNSVLCREIARNASLLPLQQGLSIGNYVIEAPVTVAVHSIAETKESIRIKAGIFYQSVIGGCSCADDPTPVSEINEYCQVQLDIDKNDAATSVRLVE